MDAEKAIQLVFEDSERSEDQDLGCRSIPSIFYICRPQNSGCGGGMYRLTNGNRGLSGGFNTVASIGALSAIY